MDLEHATSVAQALALAPSLGIPHQNFVVGDREGHIGWTIDGRIPADTGAERSNGSRALDDRRRLIRASSIREIGRIWTANARVDRRSAANWPRSAATRCLRRVPNTTWVPGPGRSAMICCDRRSGYPGGHAAHPTR